VQDTGLFDLPDMWGKYGLVHNIGLGGTVIISLLVPLNFTMLMAWMDAMVNLDIFFVPNLST